MSTIDSMMWGYQTHFQAMAQSTAEGIFKLLDGNLSPRIFLMGILSEERSDRHPICLEPDDCGYTPTSFANVRELAHRLHAADEDKNTIHSHPVLQESHGKRLKLKSLMSAVEQTIRVDDEPHGIVSFCAWPIALEGYHVIVVLQLDYRTYHSYYSLDRNTRVGTGVSTSLLDATIREYFDACGDDLSKPDPGANLGIIDRDYVEVVRLAGRSLMVTVANAGNSKEGYQGLFDACNTIASLRYEGADSTGTIFIARKDHPNIDIALRLTRPVDMRDFRAVRKLLEISSDEYALLSDSGSIYGLGKIAGQYDQKSEDLFAIRFTKHYTWELTHADYLMMRVVYGQPDLPRMRVDKYKFASDVSRIFPRITNAEIEQLWELIIEAAKQTHGTMVVVSAGAREEAVRLANQSTTIEPVPLTVDMMRLVTAIDGAVLIDPTSNCYSIGVILDGIASRRGTPSRGARFNSAIRYVEHSSHACLAIVVSEDGSIDLVPHLMPQIHRSELLDIIEQLERLADEKNFNLKSCTKTMDWLNANQFYLLPEMCDRVNRARREVAAVRDHVEPAAVQIAYRDFTPDPDMNESYFLE